MDRHGDLAYLLDPSTGAITDTVMFDPFGDSVAETGTTGPTVGFQGDYTDPDSSEVWMGARWYNGADAAFRSRDTIFGELRTPVSLNRYTYAWASPLNYWDPDGHYRDEPGSAGDGYTKAERPTTSGGGSDHYMYGHTTNPSGGGGDDFMYGYHAATDMFADTNPTPEATSGMTTEVLLFAISSGYNPVLRISEASWAEWYSALEGACSCANFVGGGFLTAPDGRRYAVVANPWVEQDGWSIVAEGGGYGPIRHLSTPDQSGPFSVGVLGNGITPLLGSAVSYEYAMSLGLDANGIPANPPLGPGAASGQNLVSGTVDLTSVPAYAIISSGGLVFADSVGDSPNRATRRAADALGLPRGVVAVPQQGLLGEWLWSPRGSPTLNKREPVATVCST